MKKIRAIAIVLGIVMALSGCGSAKSVKTAVQDSDIASYPLKGDLTFTCWRQLAANLSASYSNQGETPYEEELKKRTGVTVKYQHPAAGNVQESFNILISSGDLPDLIYYPWEEGYPGGTTKAISDGQIQPLTDKMEKYAPAYKKYLDEHEDIDRAVRTDNGDYPGFASISGDDILCTSAGLMIRKDWLDELGLAEPETMDEIYIALKAMKEKKNVELPYSGDLYQAAIWGIFSSAYGIMPELYVDGNQVVYGAAKPGYKEFLSTMKKWYDEGLIDNSFTTLDSKTINSNMINGFAAMTNGAGGSGLGVYLQTARQNNPNYDLAALKSPVLNKGDKPMCGHYARKVTGHYMAITKACKNVEAAMKYLDYNYTDEGHMLTAFGIEGVSYNMVDGEPVYTDFIMNNPEGKNVSTMMAPYMLSSSVGGGFVADERYIMQYYKLEQQKDALKKWSYSDAEAHSMPLLNVPEEESSEISRILADMRTLSQSMTMKFIMGTEPLENFDSFVQSMKEIGLDKLEKAYTEALQRYNSK